MNYDESAKVLTKVLVGFPSCRWTQEQEHEFLHELVINGLDFQVAVLAVARLKGLIDFAPSWREFMEAYRFVFDDLQRAVDAKRALHAPKDEDEARQRQINVEGLRMLREVRDRRFPGALLTSVGVGVALDFGIGHGREINLRGHDHKRGADHCRVCKKGEKHDHSDKRTIGFAVDVRWSKKLDGSRERVEHLEPIPAWHLTCPRCGGEFPDLVCDTWTPIGAQMMRDRGHARQVQADETF